MKKHLFLIPFVFACFNLNAQVAFQKAYGGMSLDGGKYVRQSNDGGYIIAGTTTSYGSGGQDIYVIKTNAFGDTIWTKTFGGATDNDYGFCVQLTFDGGYIVSGTASSFADVAGDMYLLKLNSSGDTTWTRTYGGIGYEWGASVQQTSDSGYIISGQTPAFGAGGFDAYLVKINPNGDINWTKTYGGAASEIGSSIQQTTDGGYILAGEISSFGAGAADFYLVKTDSIGNAVWTKSYGKTGNDAGLSVKQTSDGGYIIAGTSEDALGPLGPDMCLIKTNVLGDTLWAKLYGDSLIDECYDVIQTHDGGYIMCGKSISYSASGDFDVYVVKVSSHGEVQWSKTYGNSSSSSSNDVGNSIQQTNDGGFIIAGESLYGFGVGLMNVYLIKTDSLGNSGCNQGTAATITSDLLPLVTIPPTIVSSGGVMSIPATIIGEGTTVTNLCFSTEIYEHNTLNIFKLYPNPANDLLVISYPLLVRKEVTTTVTDITGKVIPIAIGNKTTTINSEKLEVNTKDFAEGVYFVRLQSSDFVETRKLIIAR